MFSTRGHRHVADMNENDPELLRNALVPILDAYVRKGPYPQYYDYVKNGLRKEWPALAKALEDAVRLTSYEDRREEENGRRDQSSS